MARERIANDGFLEECSSCTMTGLFVYERADVKWQVTRHVLVEKQSRLAITSLVASSMTESRFSRIIVGDMLHNESEVL